MQLPIGVYVVAEAFGERTGTVTFLFQGQLYTAQIGVNAFSSLDDVSHASVEKVDAPFCAYEDMTIVIFPAGTYMLGTSDVRIEKFRTYFPYPVALLGENAGISPNEADLRTKAVRREESVLDGAFYFGTLAMEGAVDGPFILDGVTLYAKLYDERTGGRNTSTQIKNCILDARHSQHCVMVGNGVSNDHILRITDCRIDGLHSLGGEGNIVSAEAGHVVLENLYIARSNKFFGMTNFSRTRVNGISSLLLQRCLFENCQSIHGLTLNLPADSTAKLLIEDCSFRNVTPEDDSVITAVLPKSTSLTLRNTGFIGNHTVPAVLADGPGCVIVEDCRVEGYAALYQKKPVRRKHVDVNKKILLRDPHAPEDGVFTFLDNLYQGRQLYFGDFHCHSNSGGTSDGETPIENYIPDMKKLGLDFAAIVDHKQMRHFFLPCWDEQYLICGTEPGNTLNEPDRPIHARRMDYTMIFPDKTGLAKTLEAFPRFGFSGSREEGSFKYVNWTLAELRELAEYIYSSGGLLSHAHPKQLMVSDDPMDYYISDLVPLETIQTDPNAFSTWQNRKLWVQLLEMGKRVRTHGSSDSHGPVSNRGLTAVYAPRHFSTDIFNAIRAGDCVAGGVGIQMSIDDVPMGSATDFAEGKKLYIRVTDFHFAHKLPDTVYCLKVFTEQGLAYAQEFTPDTPPQVILPVQKRLFYRVEITNESDDLPVAISNPIWINEQFEGRFPCP